MVAISVLIADSQPLVSDALALALKPYPYVSVCDEHPSSGEVVLDAVDLFRPDVVLLDYWIQGIQAPGVIQAIQERVDPPKVIVLSWLLGSHEIENVLYAGAVGFIPKSVTVEYVAEAVRRAHLGENPVFGEELERLAKKLADRDAEAAVLWRRMRGLSRREMKVLVLLSLGRSARQIADELSLSERTVTNYIHEMLKKTAARSQTELLAMARKSGLIAG